VFGIHYDPLFVVFQQRSYRTKPTSNQKLITKVRTKRPCRINTKVSTKSKNEFQQTIYKSKHQTAKGPLRGSVLSPCEDSVLRGWDPKVLLVRPSPIPYVSFPSSLVKHGGSWPPLPLVELIQKESTKHSLTLPGSTSHALTHIDRPTHPRQLYTCTDIT